MKSYKSKIDKLFRDIEAVQKKLARQITAIDSTNDIIIGEVVEINEDGLVIEETTVESTIEVRHIDVKVIDNQTLTVGEIVAFQSDDKGNKFVLPQSTRNIAVKDTGSGNGDEVSIDSDGSETIEGNQQNIVFYEPTSNFHNGDRTDKQNRVYEATKGDGFYAGFIEGHGDQVRKFGTDHSTNTTLESYDFQLDLKVDGQGNLLGYQSHLTQSCTCSNTITINVPGIGNINLDLQEGYVNNVCHWMKETPSGTFYQLFRAGSVWRLIAYEGDFVEPDTTNSESPQAVWDCTSAITDVNGLYEIQSNSTGSPWTSADFNLSGATVCSLGVGSPKRTADFVDF